MTYLKTALDEQQHYYDERAPEYDDWWFRKGMFDEGAVANARWFHEAAAVQGFLKNAKLTGEVLELAAGTGLWSQHLIDAADSLTLVDGSDQMLARNPVIGNPKVSAIKADLFGWQPGRTFDAVAFAFWISHVPSELIAAFLANVASYLKPGGRVFFVDNLGAPEKTAPHVVQQDGQFTKRRLADGRQATVVKNFYVGADLQGLFAASGLDVEVQETATLFQYGLGRKR